MSIAVSRNIAYLRNMTTTVEGGLVPEWTTGDRLRKARSLTGMTLAEFAAATLISAKTIGNYEADRFRPKPLALKRWAEVTGVSETWLLTGVASTTNGYRKGRAA